MIIKICLSLALLSLSTLIGYKIGERRKCRKEIFSELLSFNRDFMSDIGLFENSVIYSVESQSGILKETFFGAAESFKKGEEFLCVDKRLSLEERQLVSRYVNSLGKSDLSSQRESLFLFEEKLKIHYLSLENDFQKYAKLYVKLGFSLGLIALIILF